VNDVCVATVTWARDAAEEETLRRSLSVLGESTLPVAVADRGSSAVFTEFLTSLPRFVVTVPAARSEASFATFPPFQRYTEGTINHLCAQLTGLPADYSYGPILLNRALVPHIETLAAEIGWGWRHFLVGAAPRLGYRVLHVAGDYPCPPDQQAETDEDRWNRMRQLSQNIEGLVLAAALHRR
jgi:hypothetical protein